MAKLSKQDIVKYLELQKLMETEAIKYVQKFVYLLTEEVIDYAYTDFIFWNREFEFLREPKLMLPYTVLSEDKELIQKRVDNFVSKQKNVDEYLAKIAKEISKKK